MAACMSGHEEDLGLFSAERIDVAVLHLHVHPGNAVGIMRRADDDAAGGVLDFHIPADMVGMMVGVEDMGDLPAQTIGLVHHRSRHRRIHDGHRVTHGLAHEKNEIVRQHGNLADIEHGDLRGDSNVLRILARRRSGLDVVS